MRSRSGTRPIKELAVTTNGQGKQPWLWASDRKGALGKAPKPIQDMRVDMPVIGARTVEMAAAAGLAGIGGLAGKLILIDRAAIIEAADRLGLYVWGEDR